MRRVSALVLLLATAACGGPKPSLTFGGKAVAVNVAFGKPAPDDPRAPDVPYVLGPVLGGVGVVPVAEEMPAPRAGPPKPFEPYQPPPTCPVADPSDVRAQPKAEAGRDLGGAPKAGLLPYRIDGTSVAEKTTSLKGVIYRAVTDTKQAADGTVTFKVVTFTPEVTSTASYVSTPAGDQLPGSVGLKGVRATGRGIDGSPSFDAPKPVTLLQLRPTPGLTWKDATFDPLTATSFVVQGSVPGKDRVDACGQFVDAWRVVLSQDMATPLQQVHAEITYWIATQYGGLIVQEAVSWSGTAGTTPIHGQYTATVDKDPGA